MSVYEMNFLFLHYEKKLANFVIFLHFFGLGYVRKLKNNIIFKK